MQGTSWASLVADQKGGTRAKSFPANHPEMLTLDNLIGD